MKLYVKKAEIEAVSKKDGITLKLINNATEAAKRLAKRKKLIDLFIVSFDKREVKTGIKKNKRRIRFKT